MTRNNNDEHSLTAIGQIIDSPALKLTIFKAKIASEITYFHTV